MNIIGIIGSKDPRGRTARAARALLRGAGRADASWEMIFLSNLDMRRCRQCEMDGWGRCRRDGHCIMEEDDAFKEVTDKLRHADAALFATPVYFSDLSECMRAYLDRLRRVCANEAAREDGLAGKPVIGLCVAGGGGGGASRCTVALEQVLLDCGLDVVDMVPARRQNLEAKLPLLGGMGQYLVSAAPAGEAAPAGAADDD